MIVDSLFWKKQSLKYANRIINFFRQNTKLKFLACSVLLFVAFICITFFFRTSNTQKNSDDFNSLDFSAVSDDLKKQHEKLINSMLENDDEKYAKLTQKYPEKISEFDLVESIHIGNEYLNQVLHQNGSFSYIYNLKQGINQTLHYNIVRHAGTIFSMATYELEFGNGKYTQNILNAVQFMKKYCLKPAGQNGMLGIWSFDKKDGSKKQHDVALGAAGLGLVALLTVEKLEKGTTPLEDLQQIGEFILFMQKENGGFYSKYDRHTGRDDRFTSLYYPGEAALGLVMLYEYDNNEKWLLGSTKALGFLAHIRLGEKEVEPDHWALLATARLWPLYERMKKPPVPKNVILNHAIQVCGYILDDGIDNLDRHANFLFDGRTTPTATRLEGLQAALTFIPKKHTNFIQHINIGVKIGIQFLINAQIKNGPNRGMMQRGSYVLDFGMETQEQLDHFNYRLTEFRIDYNQHPQSAFIQYWKMNMQNKQQDQSPMKLSKYQTQK